MYQAQPVQNQTRVTTSRYSSSIRLRKKTKNNNPAQPGMDWVKLGQIQFKQTMALVVEGAVVGAPDAEVLDLNLQRVKHLL